MPLIRDFLLLCSLTVAAGTLPAQQEPATAAEAGKNATSAGRKIVVSGFEPFGGRAVNASAKLAEMIAAHAGSTSLKAVTVPVVWGEPGRAVEAHWPGAGGLWIAFGEGAPGQIRVECLARNQRGQGADNLGAPPREPHIEPGGADELEQPFAAGELVAALNQAGFPARESRNAGRYLCEEMLYELLHKQGEAGGADPATVLFIHVPPWGTRVDETRRADAAYFEALARVVLKAVETVEGKAAGQTSVIPAKLR